MELTEEKTEEKAEGAEEIVEQTAEPTAPLSKKELKAQQKAQKKLGKKQKKLEKRRAKRKKHYRLLFPANKKGYHHIPFFNLLRVLFYPIHWMIFPFKLYGSKKVGKGACIYVGNHYTMFDVFYPAHTTWEGVHFLAKQSIIDAPVFGALANRVGVIPVMRDGSDVRTLMDSMKVLKNGEKISLFPEGTRNKVSEEEFLPFRGGAALLSIKTKSPIIPFVICSRPRVFHMTHIVFGEPMEFTEYYGKKMTTEDYEEADEKLKKRLYELRDEHRAMLAAKKKKKDKK